MLPEQPYALQALSGKLSELLFWRVHQANGCFPQTTKTNWAQQLLPLISVDCLVMNWSPSTDALRRFLWLATSATYVRVKLFLWQTVRNSHKLWCSCFPSFPPLTVSDCESKFWTPFDRLMSSSGGWLWILHFQQILCGWFEVEVTHFGSKCSSNVLRMFSECNPNVQTFPAWANVESQVINLNIFGYKFSNLFLYGCIIEILCKPYIVRFKEKVSAKLFCEILRTCFYLPSIHRILSEYCSVQLVLI